MTNRATLSDGGVAGGGGGACADGAGGGAGVGVGGGDCGDDDAWWRV